MIPKCCLHFESVRHKPKRLTEFTKFADYLAISQKLRLLGYNSSHAARHVETDPDAYIYLGKHGGARTL